MASTPPTGLPLFYNQLEALSSVTHAGWKSRQIQGAPFLKTAHAIPLTVEEFPQAQRHYPIVFSGGNDAVPLALMGLNEGVNTFVNDEGMVTENVYIPAYVRRYPWLLARLTPDAQDLSLCFDPSAGAIGDFEEGQPLFDGQEPAENTKALLKFCEEFEMAGARTANFMRELNEMKLLMDGEVSIQPEGAPQPFIYRGFRMVNEEALRNIRGDQARKMVQSGAMGLIFAHLFSMSLIRDIFARQVEQGVIPLGEALN